MKKKYAFLAAIPGTPVTLQGQISSDGLVASLQNIPMRKTHSIVFMLCLTALVFNLQAQEAIPASGGEASGSGGTASYSIGQVVYSTSNGSNGSVAEGVQLPYQITVISGLDTEHINLKCTAYPNPASDHLYLSLENFDEKGLEYCLIGPTGNVLDLQKIKADHTRISLSELSPATYFLKISESGKELKTFKIIKH